MRASWISGPMRPQCSRPSTMKVVAHNPAKDEPCRSHRALHRTADLRFPDARVIAHRDLDDATSRARALQEHLHRPPVGGLLEREGMQHVGAPGAKRAEVADLQTVEKPDQTGCEAVTECGMPGQRSGVA